MTGHAPQITGMRLIRASYGVPARRGMRVRYTGGGKPRLGVITGHRGARLLIRLDGEKGSRPYHPDWMLEYLDGEAA